jgi:hypothetical protein
MFDYYTIVQHSQHIDYMESNAFMLSAIILSGILSTLSTWLEVPQLQQTKNTQAVEQAKNVKQIANKYAGFFDKKLYSCTCQLYRDSDGKHVGVWKGNVQGLSRITVEKVGANNKCEKETAKRTVNCKNCSCGKV